MNKNEDIEIWAGIVFQNFKNNFPDYEDWEDEKRAEIIIKMSEVLREKYTDKKFAEKWPCFDMEAAHKHLINLVTEGRKK
ncbi:hypothetical protein [Vibrio owensii]|uniref:hypothetical protein n=1 Tax=Vibrio owensii TaxID=696485 RepID=UPI0038CDCB17